MLSLQEIKARARMADVWAALGGGELKGKRGAAFWRGSSDLNVAVDVEKNVWFDHVAGVGGDTFDLVCVAHGCDFRTAVQWLASFTGVSTTVDTNGVRHVAHIDPDRAADLERADCFTIAGWALAEEALSTMEPWDAERRGITDFLRAIQLGDESLLSEYREFRRRDPQLTAAMVHAGRLANARRWRNVTKRLWRYWDAKPTCKLH
jgi:hypothetical protein